MATNTLYGPLWCIFSKTEINACGSISPTSPNAFSDTQQANSSASDPLATKYTTAIVIPRLNDNNCLCSNSISTLISHRLIRATECSSSPIIFRSNKRVITRTRKVRLSLSITPVRKGKSFSSPSSIRRLAR